jgi:hypothetical protein
LQLEDRELVAGDGDLLYLKIGVQHETDEVGADMQAGCGVVEWRTT